MTRPSSKPATPAAPGHRQLSRDRQPTVIRSTVAPAAGRQSTVMHSLRRPSSHRVPIEAILLLAASLAGQCLTAPTRPRRGEGEPRQKARPLRWPPQTYGRAHDSDQGLRTWRRTRWTRRTTQQRPRPTYRAKARRDCPGPGPAQDSGEAGPDRGRVPAAAPPPPAPSPAATAAVGAGPSPARRASAPPPAAIG